MPEFVIIGGGVYGCGVAWELTRSGAEVCLLEASEIASGASGGLGKRGVRANGRDLRELPLMRRAYEIWPTLHEQLDAPTGYEQTGHLMLIEREKDRLQAEAQAQIQSQQGIPSTMLCREEVGDREPFVSESVTAALYCPKDGIADHTATTRAYAQAAESLGAVIREGTPVTGLEIQNQRVTAVFANQTERIPAGRGVLLVSNCHSLPFLKQQLGITLPAWPVYLQVLLTDPIKPVPLNHLIGHAHRALAMKVVPGNQIMISGGWHGKLNTDTQRGEIVADQLKGNIDEAISTYPCLAGVSVTEAAADRPELISVDQIPIIDQVPGMENLTIAAGWSGHGWAIAPAACYLLADWLISKNKPDLFSAFSLERFGIG